MDSTIGILIAIALAVALLILFFKVIKPYFLKYDTTILFTGGVGSGKTLNSVKMVKKLYVKTYIFNYKLYNFKAKIKNIFRKKNNKIKLHKKPYIYSNIPLAYKNWFLSKKYHPARKFTVEQFTCMEEIREYSIVFIDEMSAFVNQFNWDKELVQKNVNEFIQFFRHYVGGYFITNAQSESDIVVQLRRKLNSCIWCRNFQTHFFKLFYTVDCCTLSMSDNVTNVNQTQLEENTQHLFGILHNMNKVYDTRCYRNRRNNYLIKDNELTKEQKLARLWNVDNLTTNEIMRFEKYNSPLDDGTTKKQKEEMLKDIRKLQGKGKEKPNEKGKAQPQANTSN